jgi:hypothetical protein
MRLLLIQNDGSILTRTVKQLGVMVEVPSLRAGEKARLFEILAVNTGTLAIAKETPSRKLTERE